MLFSKHLSLGDLFNLCHILRHSLGAGLAMVDVFRQQSQRGPLAVRQIAGRLAERLRAGESLTAALAVESEVFPPLFLTMVRLGEETGHLPEIFGELEKYFQLEQRLKHQFVSQSMMPALQFLAAIFIITGLIWILGVIGESRSQRPLTLFGLTGLRGAMMFLITAFGTLGTLFAAYRFCRRLAAGNAIDALLLRIPILGGCLESFALARLSLAMQLTLDSNMPIIDALRMSLSAMSNRAYTAHTEEVVAALRKKRPLAEALALVRPLPSLFLDMVATAEEGGRVPEMMRHQAAYYQEESSRRLTTLTKAASTCLWLVYAGCMIYAIFTIFKVYLNLYSIDK